MPSNNKLVLFIIILFNAISFFTNNWILFHILWYNVPLRYDIYLGLSAVVAAFEAFAFGRLFQFYLHVGQIVGGQPYTVRVVAVRQRDDPLPEERLPAAEALLEKRKGLHKNPVELTLHETPPYLQEARRSDHGRLHLTATSSLAFIDGHFSVASPLQSAHIVVVL